jgi:hypothetical protein
MGAMFSGPPDTSKQEKMLKQQQERLDKQEREKQEQLMSRRRAMGRGGMASLLSPERTNAEQGLSSTLGGGQ